jgi:hypothetical protein
VRALAYVSFVLNLLRAHYFEFFILNVMVEFFLALKLRLILCVDCRVVLLVLLISADYVGVLMQLNFGDWWRLAAGTRGD